MDSLVQTSYYTTTPPPVFVFLHSRAVSARPRACPRSSPAGLTAEATVCVDAAPLPPEETPGSLSSRVTAVSLLQGSTWSSRGGRRSSRCCRTPGSGSTVGGSRTPGRPARGPPPCTWLPPRATPRCSGAASVSAGSRGQGGVVGGAPGLSATLGPLCRPPLWFGLQCLRRAPPSAAARWFLADLRGQGPCLTPAASSVTRSAGHTGHVVLWTHVVWGLIG